MKRWIRNTAFKITSTFFLILFLCATFTGSVSILAMMDTGIYTQSKGSLKAEFINRQMQNDLYTIMDAFLYNYGHEFKDIGAHNLRYTITDMTLVLENTYDGEYCTSTYELLVYKDPFSGAYYTEHYRDSDKTPKYLITGYLLEDLPCEDIYSIRLHWIDFFYEYRWTILCLTIFSFTVALLLTILLLAGAGRSNTDDEIHLSFWDRIPYDLLLLGFGFFLIFEFYLLNATSSVMLIPLLFITSILLVPLLLTTTIRLKAGVLLQNTLCRHLLRYLWKGFRLLLHGIRSVYCNLSLLWQVLVGLCVFFIIEFFFVLLVATEVFEPIDLILMWFLEKIPLTAGILYITLQMRRLQKGTAQIASGDLQYQIDTSSLMGPFERHGEDLNHIREGMQKAVATQLRSEHMKTELITNVSHDIKTPLTSIINYVDLLKKEELPSDTTREYLDVLDRQSSRLKKLIEDLVEASKASTGNLEVNLEPCEVDILLEQAAAEYADRLRSAGLELVTGIPESPITILADGRHLWRIFDNLLNNIAKYALSGTRVYLNLTFDNDQAVITFRNISRSQLNITAEDLMERFVRGDSSRNTEGSGLGLSIARSLTELQQGTLDLMIDGDLFKVILIFPLIEE